MKTKSAATRRNFRSAWDEIVYLYDKLLYWFYDRQDPRRARPLAQRLERLLRKADPAHDAILGEECWSLIYELEGDLRNAIKHRENEIRMMKRLHAISRNTPAEGYVLQQRGYDDLSDRLDLLAILYHDYGDLDKAIRTLEESQRLCKRHGIEFDGKDLLRDYRSEKSALRNGAQRHSQAARVR
ncbi:MAG TPA: hypothetical protein VKI65_04505 [Gemmataceae bacterium]|nr:hypothetical protein [Gemmataceae bacterium]